MSHFPPVILIASETPSGLVNGVNAAFTTAKLPRPGYPVVLRVAGVAITAFTIAGNTLTLTTPPLLGQSVSVDYWY